MTKKIDRRTFLWRSTIIGTTTFIGAGMLPELVSGISLPEEIDIAVAKGADYFENTKKAVELLGGIGKFVTKDAKVGLLINSPWKKPGSYTSPDVALAVVDMCFEAGAKEVYSLEGAPEDFWTRSNKIDKFKDKVAKIKPVEGHKNVEIPKGVCLKKAEVSQTLFDCDVFINIPVVKHHKGTNFSGLLKNMMGLCPHSTNKFFHYGTGTSGGYDDIDFLSQCIADLNLVRKPDLCIVDATEFITTNGPAGPGEIKKEQKVIAGTDPVALDTYSIGLLGRSVDEINMIKFANKHGLGEIDLEKLTIREIGE